MPAEAAVTQAVRTARDAVRRHYDAFPFFLHPRCGPSDEKFFASSLTGELIRTAVQARHRVLDVGCGPGRVAAWLLERAHVQPVGIDLSLNELRTARTELGIEAINGDCLDLPVATGSVDVAMAVGVIHHTPDPRRAFRELSRVTQIGGLVHVAVYQRGSLYHWLHRVFAPPYRLLRRVAGVRALRALAFPLYHLSFRLFLRFGLGVRERLEREAVWRFFMDQFLVPCVSFHSRDEILSWAAENGLELVGWRAEFLGEHLAFVFRKRALRMAPDGQ